MRALVVHDDVGFAGSKALKRALAPFDGLFQHAHGGEALGATRALVSEDDDARRDLNDGRDLDKLTILKRHTGHERLLRSGPSRIGSAAATAIKFKLLISRVNTGRRYPVAVRAG